MDVLTKEDLADRLKFLGIDARTTQALRNARTILGQALPEAVDRFYEYLANWPSMMAMFRDPSRRKHARDSQVRHWEILFQGDFGPAYLESVQRIGATHSRIGLDTRWFIGAYGRITGDLLGICTRVYAPRLTKDHQARQDLELLLQSVILATNLDMDLVVDVYNRENDAAHRRNLDELSTKFRTSVATSLSQATAELSAAAGQIKASATETVAQGQAVDQAARNAHLSVQSIAAALEEVSRSVIEIRGQTERSTAVAADAVAQARAVEKVMNGLSDAVTRIDESVALINDIAERTNILAINASIEAARAGNVGRGFAVVAGEVRTLASQTVGATQSITTQIQTLKTAAHQNYLAIEGIVSIIGTIDKTTASIAGAVDEQGTVTQDTAREAQKAADESISVSRVIEVVTQAAQQTGSVAGKLDQVLAKMGSEFEALNHQVDAFVSQIG
jgi:methyl-accepting chemotaxis protein